MNRLTKGFHQMCRRGLIAEERMTTPTREAFAAFQPRAGDTYLHCGHVGPGDTFHIWKMDIKSIRPDESAGEAKWLTCCGPCFHTAGGNRRKVPVQGDATWSGDDLPLLMVANPREPERQPSTEPRLQDAAGSKAVEARQSDRAAFDMSVFDCWPELASWLQEAAKVGWTAELVTLNTKGPGPAEGIEKELREGRVPATVVALLYPRGCCFAVSTEAAIRLLRTHCQVGGGFVADRLEGRAELHECWIVTVGAGHVDACSHTGAGPGLFVRSDFSGQETYEADAQELWLRDKSLEVTTSRCPGRYQREGLA